MLKLNVIDDAFGKVIKKQRLFEEFTQEAISEETGLARSYISELEMGKKDPSLFTIFKIAKALKIKPSLLIDEIEQQIN